jgi:hypothetical protein
VIFFPETEKWLIPRSAWAESFKEMALDGLSGNEGIALWLGRSEGNQVEITHLVVLRGTGIVKEPDLLVVGASLLNDVTDLVVELGVRLVGQIHSHGRKYGTNLSYSDRRNGVKIPSYLSIVAPDYALRPDTRLAECGVHVFEKHRGFRRLSAEEVRRRVMVVEGVTMQKIVVGAE